MTDTTQGTVPEAGPQPVEGSRPIPPCRCDWKCEPCDPECRECATMTPPSSPRAGEAALDRLRLELNVYDATPVHEIDEETTRAQEGRIIIAAREVVGRAGEAEGGARLTAHRLAEAIWASGISAKFDRPVLEAAKAIVAALASPEPDEEGS